jgi:hypothetical protein
MTHVADRDLPMALQCQQSASVMVVLTTLGRPKPRVCRCVSRTNSGEVAQDAGHGTSMTPSHPTSTGRKVESKKEGGRRRRGGGRKQARTNERMNERDSPVHEHTTTGVQAGLYEAIAVGEVLQQVLVVHIVDFDDLVLVGCKQRIV